MKFKVILLVIYIGIISIFFKDVFLKSLLPIPSDTIVGLYHPYRDRYASEYPNGIPFKNFLTTDPVRQQYPWKNLVIEAEKKFEFPLWNPYSFSGSPLLANFQSAAFYPLNFLFFLMPFELAWSLLIISQPILAGLFMFLFLKNLKLELKAAMFGSLAFAFCGFAISWMEWGNIVSVYLWLPMLFLAIDKLVDNLNKRKELFIWLGLYSIALLFSFFAGHLQIFFYILLLSTVYFIYKLLSNKSLVKVVPYFFIANIIFVVIALPSLYLVFQFINLSARNSDQIDWLAKGWFIPWQNAVQFIAPDFFGNPTTLNYFGEWNYGEFIGYIGVIALFFAIYSLFKVSKEKIFFIISLLLSLVFAFPNLISKLPFYLHIPFISTSQPTRLLAVIDFCLIVLASYGIHEFIIKKKDKKIFINLLIFALIFTSLWLFVFFNGLGNISAENLLVTKRNLVFPTVIFISLASLLVVNYFFVLKNKQKYIKYLIILLIAINLFDLFRMGWKYLTFSKQEYLYPTTKALSFLQENTGLARIMETNGEIFPPNFAIMYKLQSIDGYDPLYLQRYGELMASVGRNSPDIHSPFGFNRIIKVENYKSPIIDLLGVKYILTADKLEGSKYVKVLTEGKTHIYENNGALPRAFFVQRTINAVSKQDEINKLYENIPLSQRAVVASSDSKWDKIWNVGAVKIVSYSANKVEINTDNEKEGFLILTDSYYPSWKASIDGNNANIYLTDYNFRGVIIPAGKHKLVFYNTLF